MLLAECIAYLLLNKESMTFPLLMRPYRIDLTAMFGTKVHPIHVDAYHLRPEMQPMVASEIFTLIVQKNTA